MISCTSAALAIEQYFIAAKIALGNHSIVMSASKNILISLSK
jgi:hypothetical protein